MRASVCRKAHFNAAHRLFNPDWDDDKNEAVFGPCSNPFYHGHNYELIVKLTGEIDPVTGFVYDLGKLKKLIQREVLDYLDHKNLNEQIEEFKQMNPTAEHIAVVIWNRLRPHVSGEYLLEVKLYETARNFVLYSGN